MATNNTESGYSDLEKLLAANGLSSSGAPLDTSGSTGTSATKTSATGTSGTDTSGLLSSDEFTAAARKAADDNYKVQTDLAKKVFDTTYKALDNAYANTEQSADAAKKRSLVDADSAYKLSELKYGAAEEFLSGSGLSGSGLSEYQRSQAYAQNRQDRQATYAEYDKIMREAEYNRDLGKADADIKYAEENAAAQIEYNNAMAKIGEQGISYAMLERQETDAAYRGYIDGIKNGAMTLEQVMADSYWSKLTDAQKSAIKGAENVKILQNKISGDEDIGTVKSMEGFSLLSAAQQSEVIADYYSKHALKTGDVNAASSDYIAMIEAGVDISVVEAYAARNGQLQELKDSGYWSQIVATAGEILSDNDLARDTVYNQFIDDIQSGTRTLSQIKATTSYQKLVEDHPEMASAIEGEFVRVGLAIVDAMESEFDGILSKGSIRSNLKKYNYENDDIEAVIDGWQESNFEELKTTEGLLVKDVTAAHYTYGLINEEQARELYQIIEDRKFSESAIPYDANRLYDEAVLRGEEYLSARNGNLSATSASGGWYIDGLGAGRKGDTFKISIGTSEYDEDAYKYKLKSAGVVDNGTAKAINKYLEKLGIDTPSINEEGWDLSLRADHTISDTDEGKSNKLIVFEGEMYLYAKQGWVRLVNQGTGDRPVDAIAEYLRMSDTKKIFEFSGGELSEEDLGAPEATAERLISKINTSKDDVYEVSKLVNALNALQQNAKLFDSTKDSIKNTLGDIAGSIYSAQLYSEDANEIKTTEFKTWDDYINYKAAADSLKEYATVDSRNKLNDQLKGAAEALTSDYSDKFSKVDDASAYIESYNELASLHGKISDKDIEKMQGALDLGLENLVKNLNDRIDNTTDLVEYARVRDEINALKPYIDEEQYKNMLNTLNGKTDINKDFDLKNSSKKKGQKITSPDLLSILNGAIAAEPSKSGQAALVDGKWYYYEKGLLGNYEWYELVEDLTKPANITADTFKTNADGSKNYTTGQATFEPITGIIKIDGNAIITKAVDEPVEKILDDAFPDAEKGDYVNVDGRYYIKNKTSIGSFTLSEKWVQGYNPIDDLTDSVTGSVEGVVGDVGAYVGLSGVAPKDYVPSNADKDGARVLDDSEVQTKHEGNMQVKTFLHGTNQVVGFKTASVAQQNALNEKFKDANLNTYVVMGGFYFVRTANLIGVPVWKRVSVV